MASYSIAVDGADNVAVGGLISSGTVDFGGGPRTTPGAPHDELSFIAEFDKDGAYRWDRSTTVSSAEGPGVDHLAMNAAGQIAATVGFTVVNGPDRSQIVSSYSPSGATAWSKTYFTSNSGPSIFPRALGIDTSGAVYVRDDLWGGTLDFGGGPISNGVIKFDATGTHVWSKAVPATSPAAFDASGDTFVMGAITGCGPANANLTKLDPMGSCAWAKAFTGAAAAYDVAATAAGEIYIAAVLGSGQALDVGCGSQTNTGLSSLMVAKLDSLGACLWSTAFTSPDFDLTSTKIVHVTTDGVGDVFVSGLFKGTIDFGDGPRTDTAYASPFIAKLGPTGTVAWSTQTSQTGVWAGGAGGALYLATWTNAVGMTLSKLAP